MRSRQSVSARLTLLTGQVVFTGSVGAQNPSLPKIPISRQRRIVENSLAQKCAPFASKRTVCGQERVCATGWWNARAEPTQTCRRSLDGALAQGCRVSAIFKGAWPFETPALRTARLLRFA